MDDTRDKVIALEANLTHLTRAVEDLTAHVNELTTLLERSRGALWVITTISGIIGFVVAKVATLFPWLPK